MLCTMHSSMQCTQLQAAHADTRCAAHTAATTWQHPGVLLCPPSAFCKLPMRAPRTMHASKLHGSDPTHAARPYQAAPDSLGSKYQAAGSAGL